MLLWTACDSPPVYDVEELLGQRYLEPAFDEIEVKYNIPYDTVTTISGNEQTLYFDFYEAINDTATKRRLLLLLGGQDYTDLDKSQMDTLAHYFATLGYPVANIDYRTYDGVLPMDSTSFYRTMLQARVDLLSAVRFFRKDTLRYGLAPFPFLAVGYSAGGFTALSAAYMDTLSEVPTEQLAFIEEEGGIRGDNFQDSTSIQIGRVVNIGGGVLDAFMLDRFDPPLMSVHGTADTIIPYCAGQSIFGNAITDSIYLEGPCILHERAELKSLKHVLMTVQEGSHKAFFRPEECEDCLENVVKFLAGRL
ncbi:MAG: alpha/beta hydrolase family protein [Chitinophagales bacterium]